MRPNGPQCAPWFSSSSLPIRRASRWRISDSRPGTDRTIIERGIVCWRYRERLAYYRTFDAGFARSGAGPSVREALGFGIRHEEAVLQRFAGLPREVLERHGNGQADPLADPAGSG
jgi:hypothetical protein